MAERTSAGHSKQLPYVYVSLDQDEIRLLELEEATLFAEPVRCKMHTIRLRLSKTSRSEPSKIARFFSSKKKKQDNELHHFSALSYAWGPTYADGSHLSDSVICDGRQLPATPNLTLALKRIASGRAYGLFGSHDLSASTFSTRRLLWVDALCINQNDTSEKSIQVAMMDRIYTQAARIIVWLGEPGGGRRSYGVLNGLRRVNGLPNNVPPPPTPHEVEYGGLLSVEDQRWHQRRWAVQEYTLGGRENYGKGRYVAHRSMVYGDLTVNDDEFYRLLSRKLDSREISRLCPAIASEKAFGSSTLVPAPILELLWSQDGTECSDPRDLLYALRGAANDCDWLNVDYHKSVEQLYIDFAVSLLQQRQVLEEVLPLLAHAASRPAPDTLLGRLPSWVPDWRLKLKYRTIEQESCLYGIYSLQLPSTGVFGAYKEFKSRIHGPFLMLHGWLLEACFPPQHQQFNQNCQTCSVFARQWHVQQLELSPSPWARVHEGWSRELKADLEQATRKRHVIFKPFPMREHDLKDQENAVVFILSRQKYDAEPFVRYKLESCFAWTAATPQIKVLKSHAPQDIWVE